MSDVIDGTTFFEAEVLRWREKKLQAEALKLAKILGWTHAYHSFFSDRSEAGYPDVHLLRPATKESIYIEFKTMKGKLSAAQESWRDALLACGQRWYKWRPCCWNSGEIERVLK